MIEYKIPFSEDYVFDIKKYIAQGIRTLITGISGSGKSNAAKIILEGLLKLNFPLFILDTESEYASLNEICENLIVIGGKYADMPLERGMFDEIIELFFHSDISIVLDMAGLRDDEQRSIASEIMERLYLNATTYKKAFFLVIEECDIFAPQKGSESRCLKNCKDIAERGRKRGIHSIWITQRTAEVNKSIIANCNVRVLGKMILGIDINKVKDYLSEAGIKVTDLMLLDKEFYILSDELSSKKIKFKKCTITDLAETPLLPKDIKLKKRESKKMKGLIEELIKKSMERAKAKEKEKSAIEKLKAKIESMESDIVEKEVRIDKLENQLEITSRIKASMEGSGLTVTTPEKIHVEKVEKHPDLMDELAELKSEIKEKDSYIEKISKENEDMKKLSKAMPLIKKYLKEIQESFNWDEEESEKKESKVDLINHPDIQAVVNEIKFKSSNRLLVDRILALLARCDVPLTYSDIATAFGYKSTTSISSTIVELDDAKLIKRTKLVDKDDKKRTWYIVELNLPELQELVNNNSERIKTEIMIDNFLS